MVVLEAGQAAGGDKRGKQSAALKVFNIEEFPGSTSGSTSTAIRGRTPPRLRDRKQAALAFHNGHAVAQGSPWGRSHFNS